MSAHHHPDIDALSAYASGSAAEPVALALAVHLSHCPSCLAAVRRYEDVGGALLAESDGAPIDTEAALVGVLAIVENELERDTEVPPPQKGDVPCALAERLPSALDDLPWKRVARGVSEFQLTTSEAGYTAKLLKINPGAAVPRHTHRGDEFTVVLKGVFDDGDQGYRMGDFATADPSVRHSPVATASEACICLAVTNAPLRLLTPFGRLLGPFLQLRDRI
jgi:putative transcriptional regulator